MKLFFSRTHSLGCRLEVWLGGCFTKVQDLGLISLRVPVLIWLPDGPRGPVGSAVGPAECDARPASRLISINCKRCMNVGFLNGRKTSKIHEIHTYSMNLPIVLRKVTTRCSVQIARERFKLTAYNRHVIK